MQSPDADGLVRPDRAARVLLISFVFCTVVGSAYVFWRWHSRSDSIDGLLRSITFVCCMGAAHLWGYRLYRRQGLPVAKVASPVPAAEPVALDYRNADMPTVQRVSRSFLLGQQIAALLIASTILDGGTVATLCLVSIGVYWFMVILGRVLRCTPTAVDRVLLNVGFWPLMFVIQVLARVVWAIKGVF